MTKEIILELPPKQYISKSFVITAVQYNGKNEAEVFKFCPELQKPQGEVNYPHLIIGDRILPLLKDCWVGRDNEGRFFITSNENFNNGFDILNS